VAHAGRRNGGARRFGLFWDPQYTALYNGFVNAAPFSPQVTRYGVRFEDPYGTAANPFPASFAPFQPPPDAAVFLPLGTVGVFSQGFRPSYMETFNVTLEREIARNLAVRASYIGNMGRHLSYTDTQNYAVYAPGASAGNIQQRRPYQNFGKHPDRQIGGHVQLSRPAAFGGAAHGATTCPSR